MLKDSIINKRYEAFKFIFGHTIRPKAERKARTGYKAVCYI